MALVRVTCIALLFASAILLSCGSRPRVNESAQSAEQVSPPVSPPPRTDAESLFPVRVASIGVAEVSVAATASVEISTRAKLEFQNSDGAWDAVPDLNHGMGYSLGADCPIRAETNACTELRPGQQLLSVPWTGYRCAAQCDPPCPDDSFRAGIYRWVVTSCDGRRKVVGPVFELPRNPPTLHRWRAAVDVESATAMRVSTRLGKPVSDQVAGYPVQLGTQRPLSSDLVVEFTRLLSSDSSFDDSVVDRCLPGLGVGLRLVRKSPLSRLGSNTTDLALDFGCNRLMIGSRTGGQLQATSFERSRTAFIAFAQKALPRDPELQHLK
jgi:hypothetical protein